MRVFVDFVAASARAQVSIIALFVPRPLFAFSVNLCIHASVVLAAVDFSGCINSLIWLFVCSLFFNGLPLPVNNLRETGTGDTGGMEWSIILYSPQLPYNCNANDM